MMRQGRRRCARDRGTALSSTEGGSRATRRGCERGRRARTKETHVIHARLRGARPRASSRHGGVAASAASAGAVNAVVFLEPAGGRPTRRELLFLGAGGGFHFLGGRFFRSWFERRRLRATRRAHSSRRAFRPCPRTRAPTASRAARSSRPGPTTRTTRRVPAALASARDREKKGAPGASPGAPPPSERPSDPARPPPPPRRT